MENPDVMFKKLYLALMQTSVKQSEKLDVLEIVTKLNRLNYNEKLPFITTWTCTDMLLHVIGLLKEFGHEELFLVELCQLIINVAAKQKIVVCSMSVNVILHGLKDIWLQVLSLNSITASPGEICDQVLGAISAVTYGNGAYILPELLEWIIGKGGHSGSIASLLVSPVSMELKKTCLQCLSGLCMTSESREKLNEDYMHYCLQLFIQALQSVPQIKDVPHYRVIFASHRGLQYILDGSNGIHVNEIGPLLAILKKHLVFGLAMKSDDLPAVLQPIPIPDVMQSSSQNPAQQNVAHHPGKKKKRNRRKHASSSRQESEGDQQSTSQSMENPSSRFQALNIQDSSSASTSLYAGNISKPAPLKINVASSESEYSDTEGGQFSAMTSFALKIRQMAIGSLHTIVKKTSKLIMLGYWNSFISGTSSYHDISLLSCIINDPAPKARVAALMVLCAMLDGSRTFLSLAIQKAVSTSYVSFSAMLTSSVHDIHNTLFKAITTEQSSLVLVHLLKALSSLAANSPYTKLRHGFVSNIISKVRPMMSSRYIDCRIGAINVFISLLGSDPALSEIASCIAEAKEASHAPNNYSDDKTVLTSGTPDKETEIKSWLIEYCINLCVNRTTETSESPLPLSIAALQLITTASRLYFSVVKHYLIQLTSVISSCMVSESPIVRLHASKMLQEIGKSLLRHQQTEPQFISTSLTMWQDLLSGPIQSVVQDEENFLNRSHACDALATIGPAVFEQLPQRNQLYCQTLLLGLTSDENFLVRSASIRALAVYIMHPILRKDICFVEDVAGCILRLMKDPVKSVQSNAAWSFGNFTDAVIINVENESEVFSRDKIGNSLLMELMGTAIKAFDNKDKVRFNMMRVIGNILRFFNDTHVQNAQFCQVILQAKSLIVNAIQKDSLMKVRWNACLACGKMLRNNHLLSGNSDWTGELYDVLCSAVSSSKNYKVRIKAAIALGCATKQESFGDKFSSVYVCILNSLKNSDTSEVDFGEYKFKDKLQEHLCYTLLHLTTFVSNDDLPVVISALNDTSIYDFTKSQLSRWYNVLYSEHETHASAEADEEVYPALGQFTKKRKEDLFKAAASHWKDQINSLTDSDLQSQLKVESSSLEYFINLFVWLQ